ncbi:solute carrier family 25 member 32-like [Genypterus blacodes]|uniref:solute carrier family 25 member 32-like n=1 Tax=Genypterus blacodes TaxID=154954 RepID=UPI003F76A9F9
MSSSPNDGNVDATETKPYSKPAAVSIGGHIQRVLSHVKLENLIAGLSGGVASTLVLHPLDLVKIRFAVSDGLELRPKYSGILHCMKSVWQQQGLRGLYQGVTPNVWGAGASWGLYFFFYNAIKAYTKEGRQTELSAAEHLVSAAQAGVLTLTITNPIWVTKTRLVLQYNDGPTSKRYKGMVDALVKIYRGEGVRGLYKGYVPGLFGTSHGALQFMAYEELKRDYNKYKKVSSDVKLNPLEYITMAALSKIFAVVTTYPYQVVRARLQDQHNNYTGVIDVVRRTWRNEGGRGFYKGIIPNVIRVTPACCITFVVYENVSHFLLGGTK